MSEKIKKYTIDIFQIIIGSFIMSFGLALFLLPNQLSSGGFSGIAVIVHYLFSLPLGTIILILNVPLFIMAFFKIGKEFFIKTIIGTASLSISLDFLERFKPLTDDRFLACIYGGIIIGIGSAIILKVKSSTGGTELLTTIIKEYKPTMRISKLIVIFDIIVVATNVIFFKTLEIGLYSAIAIYIIGQMIDIFFEGINFTKIIFIVSDKYEEISKAIGTRVPRGVTRTLWKRDVYRNR